MHRKPAATRPRDVLRNLELAAESIERLKQETPTIHGLGYSQLPGPRNEKVSTPGHTDPTSSQALQSGQIKGAYRRACRQIEYALNALGQAEAAFGSAIEAADRHEDTRDPTGEYSRRVIPPMVSKRELRDAEEAKKRRQGRGEVA